MTKLVSILGFELECGMTKLETRNQKPEQAFLVSGFWFLVSISIGSAR